MTLRKALAGLAEEGVISLGGRGRFHDILIAPTSSSLPGGRVVRVLTPFELFSWASTDHLILNGLTERLTNSGLQVQIEHRPGVHTHFNPGALKSLNSLPDTAAWVLLHASEQIQRWFVESGRPTVNVGKPAEGLFLAAAYPDTVASGRHAAGSFFRLGHREMVVLRANVTSAGDHLCSGAFVQEATKLGARARIATHDGSPESVSRCLLDLISSRPRPTAFFAGANEVAISTLCHLQAAGIQVPAEASLISAWDDFHLRMAYPQVSRYHIDGLRLGQKVAGLVIDMVHRKHRDGEQLALIPEFISAGSTGPLR
jgi:LacI family transcriptional regulator